MRVFVTGGAGYVGSVCVRALCDEGHSVVVFDNLRDGGHRAAVDRRAELIQGDLSDRATLESALSRGVDAVIHFAAYANVGESVREPLRYYHNNVVNTIGLLDAMRRCGVRRMVFSSSCAVYGVPERVPIVESTRQQPISPYGRTKAIVEGIMADCAAAWGLGGVALRYFNAAGASSDGALGEDHEPESHLIPLVLRVALGRSDAVTLFGDDYPTPDGTCVRDYVHVEDLADAHSRALAVLEPGAFRAFNLGTGKGASVREVIEAARQVTGRDIPVRPAPRREGDPPELYADPASACRELGWAPKYTDIREIVRTAWTWHRSHPSGYGDR